MDTVNAFICVAGIAWCTQITLGWVQIRQFNRALSGLADGGHVWLGRSSGRFTPRVVLALSVSEEGRVTGNFVMQGLTVFSRPEAEHRLNGLLIDEILPDIIFPKNKPAREALTLAISRPQ